MRRRFLLPLILVFGASSVYCDEGGSSPSSGASSSSGSGGTGGAGGSGGAGGAGAGPEFATLDPSFGTNGLATAATLTPHMDDVFASVLQPDGKLLIAGTTRNEGFLFRVNTDGTLDTSFGLGGKVLTSTLSGAAFHAVAVAPNGDIVATGWATHRPGEHRVLVARFDTNGAPVSTFGDAGLALGISGLGLAIAVQADGKIVVAGETGYSIGYIVQRFLEDGSVDESFDHDGIVGIPFDHVYDTVPVSVTLSGDGTIVLCGKHGPFEGVAVVRLLPSGALDPSFDEDGIVTTKLLDTTHHYAHWAFHRAPTTCVVAPDGKILMAGGSPGGASVLRLDASGKPDPTFGKEVNDPVGDGVADLEGHIVAETVQLLPDGSVLTTVSDVSGSFVAHLKEDGAPLSTTLLPGPFWVRDIMVAPDGSVLATGKGGENGSPPGTTLTRLTPELMVDTTYGQEGVAVLQSGARPEYALSIELAQGGKIVSAGTSYREGNGGRSMVTRHLPDGALDTGFGLGGVTTIDLLKNAADLAVQPDDKVLLVGEPGDFMNPRVARLDAAGVLDASFGANGIVDLPAPLHGLPQALVVDAEGRVVVGGFYEIPPPLGKPYFARLLDTGEMDTSFGVGGVVSLDEVEGKIYDVLALSDGSIVATGQTWGMVALVLRLLPSGARDTSFGNLGVFTLEYNFPANRVVQEADDGLLLSGMYLPIGAGDPCEFGVARLDAKGIPDTTFGTDGFVRVLLDHCPEFAEGPAIVPLPDRSFYLATTIRRDRDTMAVYKYLPDGKSDESFGNGGRALISAPGPWAAYDALMQPDGKLVLGGRGFSPESGTDFGMVRVVP